MPERPNLDYQSPYAEPHTPPPAHTPLAIMLTTMRRKFAAGDLNDAAAAALASLQDADPDAPDAQE